MGQYTSSHRQLGSLKSVFINKLSNLSILNSKYQLTLVKSHYERGDKILAKKKKQEKRNKEQEPVDEKEVLDVEAFIL